jgi:hypothetical protein
MFLSWLSLAVARSKPLADRVRPILAYNSPKDRELRAAGTKGSTDQRGEAFEYQTMVWGVMGRQRAAVAAQSGHAEALRGEFLSHARHGCGAGKGQW